MAHSIGHFALFALACILDDSAHQAPRDFDVVRRRVGADG